MIQHDKKNNEGEDDNPSSHPQQQLNFHLP